ncbi:MAG: DUF4197 domain-containing protein [Cytophagaceae bacterium]
MKKLTLAFTFIISANMLVHGQIDLNKIKLPTNIPQVNPNNNPVRTISSSLSDTDIINGLKEALTIGAQKSADALNITNGFWGNQRVKIPFPEDCQRVAKTLRDLGYGKKVDEFELTLNRAAEQAAREAKPIFVNAIKQMSINDARNILKGPDTAATAFLRRTTYNNLFNAFSPHINNALNGTLATAKWREITTIYNRIPGVRKVDTDLNRYTTNKALRGLFMLVADEEIKIRKDPAARITDILKKVFS